MESVLWAFKQLWDKGLAYEGYNVLPYCWRDETPLSNHELRMDEDVYQSRQDPAITVGFKIAGGELDGAHLLIWTTTPWTLPSNQAVAVHPDVEYVLVRSRDEPLARRADGAERRYLLAKARLAAYARELGEEPGRRRNLPRVGAARHALSAAVSVFHGRAEQLPGAAG